MLNNIWWGVTLRIFEHLIYFNLICEFVFNSNNNENFDCVGVEFECICIHRANDVIGRACQFQCEDNGLFKLKLILIYWETNELMGRLTQT